jgi:transposase
MVYGAIDLHARHSNIRVIDAAGRVLCHRRVTTEATPLVAVFAAFKDLRILVESGTESEWVAQCLEGAGHEVIVVDPNFAPMYGELRRKVKTDDRDVTALAEANRRGWFRAAYRTSAAQRAQRKTLRVRRQLVQARSGQISLVRALLRQDGFRAPTTSSHRFAARVQALALPPALASCVAPALRTITGLDAEILLLDQALDAVGAHDPIVRRLETVPGVGPVVAVSFRAFVDQVDRFDSAEQVTAAIGLVPSEHSSAERQHRGHITKAGPRELRSLLVQSAWCYARTVKTGALRTWFDRLAGRRGKRIAIVALARRLARILYAIWRDDTVFQDRRVAA